MLKFKLNKKNDYKFVEYYIVCEFINKYNLVSFEQKPCFRSLVLEISLNDIVKSFNSKFENFNENTTQVISIIFLYFITNKLGYVNLNDFKNINSSLDKFYSLKIIFNKISQIYNFLQTIYLKISNCRIIKSNSQFYKDMTLIQKCNIEIFFELETFIKKYIKNINTKDLNFNLHFKFSNALNSSINSVPFLNK